ncbi:MAG TPA: ParB/RepB/Spo0J family partition protein [Actinomycetota bacterium]|nr:ParB/RepB/Spo0J family partition protein [Actinomycetota bacterium]
MRWDLLPDISAFDSARRKEAYRRLSRSVRGGGEEPSLLDLDDVRSRLSVFEETYEGIRPIPVARVVGTAGRSRDFDRDFLPRDERTRERWRKVEQTFPRGDFPPIVAYEVDGRYFVVDGHHRVAVAKHRGIEYIDAEVTRLRTRQPLPEGADVGALILAEQERRFLEESGLDGREPPVRIPVSRPVAYPELLELVKVHAFHLSRERGEVVSLQEAGADWYDRVYLPAVEAIRGSGLRDALPEAPEGDLFLWVYERHRALRPEEPEAGLAEAVRRILEEQGGTA